MIEMGRAMVIRTDYIPALGLNSTKSRLHIVQLVERMMVLNNGELLLVKRE